MLKGLAISYVLFSLATLFCIILAVGVSSKATPRNYGRKGWISVLLGAFGPFFNVVSFAIALEILFRHHEKRSGLNKD
jgi:hypothetical protein